MASSRTGFGLPSRPDEAIRQRKSQIGVPAGNTKSIPRPVSRMPRSEMEASEHRSQAPHQSRLPGRKAQTFIPPQLPPPSEPPARPRLDRQSSSYGAKRSIPPSHIPSRSSSSGYSNDGSLQPAHNVRRQPPPASRDAATFRQSPSKADSPQHMTRSPNHVEPSLQMNFERSLATTHAQSEAYAPPKTLSPGPVIYPELDRYRDFQRPTYSSHGQGIDVPFKLATQDLPPPTPASMVYSGSSQVSGSPSTRFSGSPGFGPYSRDTTPTSTSSQSPSIVASHRFNTKLRQNSPAYSRPPVTRRRAGSFSNDIDSASVDPQGLAAVRESLTSSSSNSTVRDGGKVTTKEKKEITYLPPPPLSPPPRKSSQKIRKARDGTASPPKAQQKASQPTGFFRPSPSPRMQSPTSPMASAPRRPSRNGTPDLHSQLMGHVPVVHSNLSSTSLPGERRGSESLEIPRGLGHTQLPHKNASTSNLPLSQDAAIAAKNLRINTNLSKPPSLDKPASTQSASPSVNSASSSRFQFFRRRKTTTDDEAASAKKDKGGSSRKGPAAGTGHEGYGRLGSARRRSGSISQLPRGTSQESLAPRDSFLADRLSPVVISGGNVEGRGASTELSRTESNQSTGYSRPSIDSRFGSEASLPIISAARKVKSPQTAVRASFIDNRGRRPSDSSDSEGMTMKSTLAFRRSVHRLRASPDSPLQMPQPINTRGSTTSPMTSFDTSVMSDESYFDPQPEMARGKAADLQPPKKLTKRARSPRKWNLFSRSHKEAEAKKKTEKVVAAVIPAAETKKVAFYAMLDSSDQEEGGGDTLDIQEVLRNADVYMSPDLSTPSQAAAERFPTPELPPFATDAPSPVSVELKAPTPPVEKKLVPPPQLDALGESSTDRPSRLAQVGRIPKVVSNRAGPPHSPVSFSRPFRASMQFETPVLEQGDREPVSEYNREKALTPILDASCDGSVTEGDVTFSSARASLPRPSWDSSVPEKDFLAFSPKKNSLDTSSSSCSSGTCTYAESTAVVPRPDDPPAEDEIWDEYDDLLGDDNKVRASTTSSQGVPFHLETYHSKLAKEKPMESPTIIPDSRKASVYSKAATLSSHYSADMTERIRAAFQPHSSPTASLALSERKSQRSLHKRQSQSLDMGKKTRVESRRNSISVASKRDSSCSECSSEDESPLAQVNLRVGSMTVSKWLTFGHVLFSDVRNELLPAEGSLKRPSILVIDGLGNDDWSFYAAETYPAATFFNLSPRAPLPKELQQSPSSFPLSPPNHHQIQFLSNQEKFPFAPQSFNCVVFRFPVAAPEAHYRNVLSEARRVLKSDGYIELSILDVDLNNMGNHGRRTVRGLKERVREETPDISVASTADLIVRLLGKLGFTNIRAARVGVPVATPLAHANTSAKNMPGVAVDKKKDQRSLADLMNENGPVADENITKMVSRVGRWWYTRCYESATSSLQQKSIWNDKRLLSECEELGTSLKLMVCCARAPERITSI